MAHFQRSLALLGLLALTAPLGCAFATQPAAMAPPVPFALRAGAVDDPPTVNVLTTGGRATELWGRSQISNAEFGEALSMGLLRSGLLQPLEDQVADYQLEVRLAELRQPSFSLITRVSVTLDWQLLRTGTREVVWRDSIHSEDTATLSQALIGTKRCRLATEGAARANIQEAIRQLVELPLWQNGSRASPDRDSARR